MTLQTERNTDPGAIRARMKGALVRVLEKTKRDRRWPRLDVAAPAPAGAASDPVRLVSFAINALGPASYRAAIFGKPVTVAVENEEMAEVMRAAVDLSSVERPTNRLIRIVVK